MKNKKNIYHFISNLKHGGVEVAARSSISKMNESNNFFIVVLGHIDLDFIKKLSPQEVNKIIEINYKSIFVFKQLLFLFQQFLKYKPDVFILSLWKASFVGFMLRFFYKKQIFVSFIHNTKFFHKLDSFFSKNAIENCDFIFVDSKSTKEFVLSINNNANITVISFLTQKFQSISRKFNSEVRNILYLGRLDKQKRIDRAIEVIYELKKRGEKIKFDIYGRDDGEKELILELVIKYDLEEEISFYDSVDPTELSCLFEKYDYYLQLSDAEGMAMSVCEAMQNGLVCFVTPVGEISNYSIDMYSAIHLREDFKLFFEKVISVLTNSDESILISKNAINSFKNQKVYADDLSETIDNILLRKTIKKDNIK